MSYHNALNTINDIIKTNNLSGTLLKITFNETSSSSQLYTRFIVDSNHVKQQNFFHTSDNQINDFSPAIQQEITNALDLIVGDFEMFGYINDTTSRSKGFDLSKLLGKEFEDAILSKDCQKIYYKALLEESLGNQKQNKAKTKI